MLDRHLQYVVATASTGSFSAAAEQIGVTQSAITKGVAGWERQVGFLIFNRGPHGVTVTERGEEFLERALRLLDVAEELLHLGSSQRDPFMDVVRIGVCPNALDRALLDPVERLLSKHPKITIDVAGGNFERIARQLRAGDVDVAVGFKSAFEDHADFEVIDLGHPDTTLFVRHGHPLLEKVNPVWMDVAEYTLIAPLDSRPYDTLFRRLYEEKGVDPRHRIHRIDCFSLVKRVVLTTDAVGFVDVSHTLSQRFNAQFAAVAVYNDDSRTSMCCAIRHRRALRPAVRAFINACRKSVGGQATGLPAPDAG